MINARVISFLVIATMPLWWGTICTGVVWFQQKMGWLDASE